MKIIVCNRLRSCFAFIAENIKHLLYAFEMLPPVQGTNIRLEFEILFVCVSAHSYLLEYVKRHQFLNAFC